MNFDENNTTVRQGVDVSKLQQFRRHAQAHPQEVQFVLEASGSYEGRVAHTRARTGPYTLGGQRIDRMARESVSHMGAHKEVEEALGFIEPTDRDEATEVVLAALTACINAVISASAVVRGIEISRLETKVAIGWSPFVFLHLSEPVEHGELINQFQNLEIDIEVAGEGLTDADRDYLQGSVARSAVFNLLSLAHASSPTVRLTEAS
jgi:hypothetical protein